MVLLLWKTVWQFLKMLNTELPHDPEIPFLDTYSGEMKPYAHRKTCIQIFIAAVFIIARK